MCACFCQATRDRSGTIRRQPSNHCTGRTGRIQRWLSSLSTSRSTWNELSRTYLPTTRTCQEDSTSPVPCCERPGCRSKAGDNRSGYTYSTGDEARFQHSVSTSRKSLSALCPVSMHSAFQLVSLACPRCTIPSAVYRCVLVICDSTTSRAAEHLAVPRMAYGEQNTASKFVQRLFARTGFPSNLRTVVVAFLPALLYRSLKILLRPWRS